VSFVRFVRPSAEITMRIEFAPCNDEDIPLNNGFVTWVELLFRQKKKMLRRFMI
jgi:hypothetical protein